VRRSDLAAALFGLVLGLCQACGAAKPNPCSAAAIATRTAATVGAVELLADARCNADRAACPVAQAGLAKLDAIETECTKKDPAP
jgi:hypothetical protein